MNHSEAAVSALQSALREIGGLVHHEDPRLVARGKRIAELEGAITAYLDEEQASCGVSYHSGSEELIQLRNVLRALVDWEAK